MCGDNCWIESGLWPVAGPPSLNGAGLSIGPGTDPSEEAATRLDGEPGFSHLGSAYIHMPDAGADTWEAAQARIGRSMLRARSNAPDRHREPKTLPRVWDHDNVFEMLHQRKRLAHAPFRAAFGLPHNYFFRGSKRKTTFEGDKGSSRSRRASPVLIHISRFGREFVPVVLWLRAKLTEGDITSREHPVALRRRTGRRLSSSCESSMLRSRGTRLGFAPPDQPTRGRRLLHCLQRLR